MLIDYRGWW